ncbi:hypothetical protein [Pseudomonas entomophila]|uniref:hypothetical protein n=1 Tax=Pseudomonas entomophila TaxID=312306 RepID=UPI001F02412F|nr:hypothetical protein [Pseudomonas entomophila]MCG8291782.1 hypothetical protein [Pseudomonas entomophila]
MLVIYLAFSVVGLAGSRLLRCLVTLRGEEHLRHGLVIFYNFIFAFMHMAVIAQDKYFYVYVRPDLMGFHPWLVWFAWLFMVLHFWAKYRNNDVNCFRWKKDMDRLK